MQDKEKFIFPNLDETQTGRDALGSSWKEQQDTEGQAPSLRRNQLRGLCLSRAVTAQRSLE